MKSSVRLTSFRLLVALGAWILTTTAVQAFPPAPPHRIYGLVRNEFGEPLTLQGAEIILQTTNGVQIAGPIQPGVAPGVNYSLDVAIDSGIAPDHYKPTALLPTLPFRILVRIGQTTYLPIEMTGSYSRLGQPAASTRIDLTLGVDSDGDGLPDAWERLLVSQIGGSLDDIRPNDDSDGDGIRNLDEYLAGTFAFDPEGGFRLNLVVRGANAPVLEFTVVKPRTYVLLASIDLGTWVPIPFKIAEDGEEALARSSYRSTDVRLLRVIPQLPEELTGGSALFKVLAQ